MQIEPRDGAWVAEATGLIDLSGVAAGTRLILRKERPHPGAQLRITDADGLRITGFLTNTAHGGPRRQLADLELRHRRHARVEDRIRAAKDTGLRNLPFHDTDQNRIWLAITALAQDLLAWCARLALPATAAGYEPKRLRLRILATAGRLVRSARRHVLHIDSTWPWADDDHHRPHPTPRAPRPLTRPPIPTTGDPEHRQTTLSRGPRTPTSTDTAKDQQRRLKITVRPLRKIEANADPSTHSAEIPMTAPTDPYAALRTVAGQLTALLAAHTPDLDTHRNAIENLLSRVEAAERTANADVSGEQRRIREQLDKGPDANPHQIGADLANIANALKGADETSGNIQDIVSTAASLATAVAPYVAPLLLA